MKALSSAVTLYIKKLIKILLYVWRTNSENNINIISITWRTIIRKILWFSQLSSHNIKLYPFYRYLQLSLQYVWIWHCLYA